MCHTLKLRQYALNVAGHFQTRDIVYVKIVGFMMRNISRFQASDWMLMRSALFWGYYAASSGNLLPTFRHNVSVPFGTDGTECTE
jgi:hypothetical protein